jgi:3-hydroxyacyl-[acyl-carrier-protein] dehydratase
MPNPMIFDVSTLPADRIVFGPEEIRRRNAQRHEMEMIDAIVHCDLDGGIVVGYKDIRPDDWWARGHIPGNPLFPGCLMVEAGAQLSSFFYQEYFKDEAAPFFGFGGIDEVRFRGAVRPRCRFYVIARRETLRLRMSRFDIQGIVENRVVFEGRIIGVAMTRGSTESAAD